MTNYHAELMRLLAEACASASNESDRHRLLQASKSFVAEKRDSLYKMHFEGAGGAGVVSRYTSLVDSVVKVAYSLALETRTARCPHALVALGGYGRKELCFCSDLDIMFLHEGRLDKGLESINDFLLYFLWDLGFKVGHSIRTITESLKLASLDDTSLTSMLESRLLAGNQAALEKFLARLANRIHSAGIKRVIRRWERERQRNYREAGDEVYTREPHIKQTAGGLRDYHTGIWIALARFRLKSPRAFFKADLLTEEQFLKLERALDFMWRVRNQMHLRNGAPQDVLTLRRQEQIAHAFGYRPSRGALAVELFMQDYYVHASELHRFYEQMLRIGGLSEKRRCRALKPRVGKSERGLRIIDRHARLPAPGSNWFRENPARLFELMWYCQKHGVMLGEDAEQEVRANLDLIDDRLRVSPVARDYFLAILSDPSRAGSTVRQMSDLGILDRYFPEFAAVKSLVRYDPFHQYPVDEHCFRALENLAAIPRLTELGTEALKKILPEISSQEILSLAVLLHDLGKVDEKSHVKKGVEIAHAVGLRLGLNDRQMESLRFLIHNHLKMTHLSQYRDLDDTEVIRSFAVELGSEENLNMLYLLTFADLYAVRQGAWNDWKSALLYQLYRRTKRVLRRPPEPEAIDFWNTPKAKAVCEYLPRGGFASVKQHLKRMSPRYFKTFSAQEIAEHMSMVSKLRHRTAAYKCVALPNYSLSQVTVCARDSLGLFARMVGTFAAQHLSVLSASVFTRSDGIAIDSFHVIDTESGGPVPPTKWAVVKENLRKVLRGERTVGELIRRAELSPRLAQRRMTSLRRGVHFDNRVSATHTVIDVEAPDRIGLLYDIASTFAELGLNLSVAKVATDVRQARDAFYVTDLKGGKINDPLRIRQIREKIEEALQPGTSSSPSDAGKRQQIERRTKVK